MSDFRSSGNPAPRNLLASADDWPDTATTATSVLGQPARFQLLGDHYAVAGLEWHSRGDESAWLGHKPWVVCEDRMFASVAEVDSSAGSAGGVGGARGAGSAGSAGDRGDAGFAARHVALASLFVDVAAAAVTREPNAPWLFLARVPALEPMRDSEPPSDSSTAHDREMSASGEVGDVEEDASSADDASQTRTWTRNRGRGRAPQYWLLRAYVAASIRDRASGEDSIMGQTFRLAAGPETVVGTKDELLAAVADPFGNEEPIGLSCVDLVDDEPREFAKAAFEVMPCGEPEVTIQLCRMRQFAQAAAFSPPFRRI